MVIGDILLMSDKSFGDFVDSGLLIDESGGKMRVEVSVACLDVILMVASPLKYSPIGYSNGRFAMISPACEVIGIERAELDHVPDLTLWKAVLCNCSVSVEVHSK